MLKENIEPQREEDWTKLHIEELLDWNFSTDIIMLIKSRRKIRVGRVALWVENKLIQNLGKENSCET